MREIFDVHGERAALGAEDGAIICRLPIAGCCLGKIVLQLACIQGRGHDDDDQVGAMLFLDVQRTRQRDVAVEMAFVKFIEDDGRDTRELVVLNELPQQDAFGLEFDFGGHADAILESYLITNLMPELHVKFLRDTGREHTRGETTRL